MHTTILIVLIVVFMLLALFIVPQLLLKRAIHQVIQIFREHKAIGINNSKMIDELGLRPLGMLERMFRARDYKQYALKALIKASIIKTTEDGRFYLSEEKLFNSGPAGNESSPDQSIG